MQLIHIQLKKPEYLSQYSEYGTRWTNEKLWSYSRQGHDAFLFCKAPTTAEEPTQSLIQWVPWALSPGIRRQWPETDHSPPPGAEVQNDWAYLSTPSHAFVAYTRPFLPLLIQPTRVFLLTKLETLSGFGEICANILRRRCHGSNNHKPFIHNPF
jgi:hypothetical protein